MGPLIHPRKANQENIQHCIELERDQYPAIAPLANRFGEAQIEQETIVDYVILHMTRGEAMNWHGHIYMDELWTRTWTCDNQSNEPIEAIHYSRDKGDENGCHKPGH